MRFTILGKNVKYDIKHRSHKGKYFVNLIVIK